MSRTDHFRFVVWSTVAAFVLAGSAPVFASEAKSPTTGLPRANPADVGIDGDVLAKIPAQVEKYVSDAQISGAVTLVAKDGRIVHLEAVGHADIEADRAMKTDDIFAIASMTKPITATAVMILQDDGLLSIDDPVSKYLPEFEKTAFQDGRAPKRAITIRDLLTHTSGVVGSQRNLETLEATVKNIAERPLGFEPGAKWQYSPGLTVCGRVVEVVSKMPFAEFLQKRIFAPLSMMDTTFHPNKSQQARVVALYKPGQAEGQIEATEHWLSRISERRSPNPSGGLFSTAADLSRFYQMILNGGELDGKRIVSKEAVKQMTKIQTGDLTTGFTPGNGWGLGWCVVREPQGVSAMISPGTFGHGGAFGTQGWVDPQRKMIFVLMIQRTGFGNSDGANIRKDFQEIAVRALR